MGGAAGLTLNIKLWDVESEGGGVDWKVGGSLINGKGLGVRRTGKALQGAC